MMLTKGPMPLPYLSDVIGRDANMLRESAVLVGKVVTFKFPVFFLSRAHTCSVYSCLKLVLECYIALKHVYCVL